MQVRKQAPFSYRDGWTANPSAAPGSIEAKAPYLDQGKGMLPVDRYYSRDFMELEWERLWTKVWTFAGREADIPAVGDYFKYDLGRESFIVVRVAPDRIQAFYNVCQHRGNPLVVNDFGNVRSFVCSFHGWQYGLDGKITHITDPETFRAGALCGTPNLVAVKCDTWAGFVFVNMDDDAEPLLDFLGPVAWQLAPYHIEKMRVVQDIETVWAANWKTALDAFQEAYHAYFVHAAARPAYDDYHSQIDLYPKGMNRALGMIGRPSPRHPDGLNDTIKFLLLEAGVDPDKLDPSETDYRKIIQQAKREQAIRLGLDYAGLSDPQLTDDWNYSFFPNVTFNLHAEGLLFQRFRPHPTDPDLMIYDNTIMMHPIADPAFQMPSYMGLKPGTDMTGNTRPERVYVPMGQPGMGFVVDEDGVLIPRVHKGLKSRAFKGYRLSEQEIRIRHFHNELDRYVLDGKQ